MRITAGEGAVTTGLCLFFPEKAGAWEQEVLDAPLILPAEAFPIGAKLTALARALSFRKPGEVFPVEDRLSGLGGDMGECAAQIGAAMDSMGAIKKETRRSQYQRLERARTFLHDVTDRQVELGELAGIAGISRFQFARNFKLAFGSSPAAYHRQVRLKRARDLLMRNEASCLHVAHRFGFADASVFSRAYRREFGHSPRYEQRGG